MAVEKAMKEIFTLNIGTLVVLGLVLTGLALFIRKKSSKFEGGSLPFSNIRLFRFSYLSLRRKAGWIPGFLVFASLVFFAIALSDPRIMQSPDQKETAPKWDRPQPTEGSAVYLVLDRSGSMKKAIAGSVSSSENSRLQVMKDLSRDFILGSNQRGLRGRPSDLIGLVGFARTAKVYSPLTLDHDAIADRLEKLDVVQEKEEEGTAIGYAIYKTASIISATRELSQDQKKKDKEGYQIQNSAIILITDGFPFVHPDDVNQRFRSIGVEEAAVYAGNQGIRLYIIAIDPSVSWDEFAPQRRLLQRSAESANGKLYVAADTGQLASIYREIDQLEKTRTLTYIEKEDETAKRAYGYSSELIFAGMMALFLAIFLEATFLRSIP